MSLSAYTTFLGAVFLTWAVSRVVLRYVPISARDWLRIAVAHFLSLLLLGIMAALLKSHRELLREVAVLPYILPQLLWFAIDMMVQGYLTRRSR